MLILMDSIAQYEDFASLRWVFPDEIIEKIYRYYWWDAIRRLSDVKRDINRGAISLYCRTKNRHDANKYNWRNGRITITINTEPERKTIHWESPYVFSQNIIVVIDDKPSVQHIVHHYDGNIYLSDHLSSDEKWVRRKTREHLSDMYRKYYQTGSIASFYIDEVELFKGSDEMFRTGFEAYRRDSITIIGGVPPQFIRSNYSSLPFPMKIASSSRQYVGYSEGFHAFNDGWHQENILSHSFAMNGGSMATFELSVDMFDYDEIKALRPRISIGNQSHYTVQLDLNNTIEYELFELLAENCNERKHRDKFRRVNGNVRGRNSSGAPTRVVEARKHCKSRSRGGAFCRLPFPHR